MRHADVDHRRQPDLREDLLAREDWRQRHLVRDRLDVTEVMRHLEAASGGVADGLEGRGKTADDVVVDDGEGFFDGGHRRLPQGT